MAGKRRRVKKRTKPDLNWRARLAIALSVTAALITPALHKFVSMTLGEISAGQLAALTVFGGIALVVIVYGISAGSLANEPSRVPYSGLSSLRIGGWSAISRSDYTTTR